MRGSLQSVMQWLDGSLQSVMQWLGLLESACYKCDCVCGHARCCPLYV